MNPEAPSGPEHKPLAGSCPHVWQHQQSKYLVAQVCTLCKLYRYKTGYGADWEYRAPIPFPRTASSGP